MPSPFPGMDPYLEDPWMWPDVQLSLVVVFRAYLHRHLPAGYFAWGDRHVLVPPSHSEKGYPYVKIVDGSGGRLLTVIELASPETKAPGKVRDAYLKERLAYLAATVNLVEIDLLRKAEPFPWEDDLDPGMDYCVVVGRGAGPSRAWPFSVRDPLPTIPIPLYPENADVLLPLGECLNEAYDSAGYARELDYTQPPNPPLDEPDATWARDLLAARAATTHQGEQP
jgi:hypothetical protein